MTITLTVTKRIATISATERVVAGNTYPVTLALDSEWTGSLYARIRFGSQYYDIPFASSDTSVNVQFPVGYPEVGIGIFSEALEICTNEVRVRLLRSILEQGVSVVDFDSDLYDQWAGEVSELLCDSDFDAESDRPVKNSVITAWKDTVPLDSALVHKTGAETIAGNKEFTGLVTCKTTAPTINLRSTNAVDSEGIKVNLVFYGGTNTVRGQVYQQRDASSEYMAIRQQKIAGSGYFDLRLRCNTSDVGWAECPSYTADNSADAKIVTRAMLASTPTVVHTTGTETIAGAKTFINNPTVKRDGDFPEVYLDTTYAHDSNSWKGRIVARDLKDGVQSVMGRVAFHGSDSYNYIELQTMKPDRSASFSTMFRSYPDHFSINATPYYPVDSGGNPQPLNVDTVVLSGNIAVDPRIVHTTGNETVAGTKQGDWRGNQFEFPQAQTLEKWLRFCAIPMPSYGTKLLEIFSLSTGGNNGACYGLALIGGAYGYDRNVSVINVSGKSFTCKVAVIINKTNRTQELWIYGTQNLSYVNRLLFSFKYGGSVSDVVYYNTEHDALPESGDEYGSPTYIVGSA